MLCLCGCKYRGRVHPIILSKSYGLEQMTGQSLVSLGIGKGAPETGGQLKILLARRAKAARAGSWSAVAGRSFILRSNRSHRKIYTLLSLFIRVVGKMVNKRLKFSYFIVLHCDRTSPDRNKCSYTWPSFLFPLLKFWPFISRRRCAQPHRERRYRGACGRQPSTSRTSLFMWHNRPWIECSSSTSHLRRLSR